MYSEAVLAATCVFTLTACGDVRVGSGQEQGQDVAVEVPHPGIAEGRPVVTIEGRGTHYLCPELVAGQVTPRITDLCLIEGRDIGNSRYDDYSQLEPSVECADGRFATDAGTLGIGIVGEPLIGQAQAKDNPAWAAAYECLFQGPR
jgi:hypothetical protein